MERTAEAMEILGSPERCFAVVADVEAYPEWVADIKEVQVLERDAAGRALVVGFRAGAFGRSTSYVLAYDYSGAPGEISWVQKEGDITNRLDGSYRFRPTPDGQTEVRYELAVELRVPIPSFVKRRAEGHILHAAVRDLKHRVESEPV
ncbi:MAG TPA: SRPBCC family protein [Acidimicrobiales bacterium]|nr:SRPBCC family protein [Acidimicrobiales bacterium]